MSLTEAPTIPKHAHAAALARAVRPYQWVKNLLVAVPLLAAHRLTDLAAWSHVALAFAAFSLVASATYVCNDLLDLAADRQHPRKKHRPFASGQLSVRTGLVTAALLAVAGLAVGTLLAPGFLACLVTYAALTALYSFRLKREVAIDVITLAGFYTLRLIAGGAATGIVLSTWLLAFSMFLFLSLAFVKRYTELRTVQPAADGHAHGRGYRPADLPLVRTLGPVSGYLAVLVFALYLSSPEMVKLYHRPHVLWLAAPVLLYWITRVWFLAGRDEMDHDPILFAVRDPVSYASAAAIAAVAVAAAW